MYSQPIKPLDIVPEGVSPDDFEKWRKAVFGTVMATRSANILSGALLAADSGVMDPDVMKDSETPGDVMCVAPMSVYLGARWNNGLTVAQAYTEWSEWDRRGKPESYQRDGQPHAYSATIAKNDPGRFVMKQEFLTEQQKQEGKTTEWKPYKRAVLSAVAIFQSNMSEALIGHLESESTTYRTAVAQGDLLRILHEIRVKSICGTKSITDVVYKAIRAVVEPRDSNVQQKETESMSDYVLRFRKLVAAAHAIRMLNGSPLGEEDCIRGFFRGLNGRFDQVKLPWVTSLGVFTSLEAAITTASNNAKEMESMQPAKRGIEHVSEGQGATRDAPNAGGLSQTKRRWTRSYDAQRANPSSSLGSQTVLHYGDQGDEELYSAEEVQRFIDDAVSANAGSVVLNVQGRSKPEFGYLSQHHPLQFEDEQGRSRPEYFYASQRHPTVLSTTSGAPESWAQTPAMYMFQGGGSPSVHPPVYSAVPMFGSSVGSQSMDVFLAGGPQQVCRNFAVTGRCDFEIVNGKPCRFAHVRPAQVAGAPPRQASTPQVTPHLQASTPQVTPVRNPFAAKQPNQ